MTSLRKAVSVSKMFARALTDPQSRIHLVRSLRAFQNQADAECPFCGHIGKFTTYGYQARIGAVCPRCGGADRHRLLKLAAEAGFFNLTGCRVLHFAPEPSVGRLIKGFETGEYLTADIKPGRADMVLNIEKIELPDARVDVVVASHVLEHVDDRKALAEIHRILAPGGKLIAMVPLIEGWDLTYEDTSKTSGAERANHFGQPDHVRFYGADFRERIRQAGFSLAEYTADGADSVRYRLNRGEKVFLGVKEA